jgi:L-alanine-DL-glutamate epimerase-like enolase superfamily enzyme
MPEGQMNRRDWLKATSAAAAAAGVGAQHAVLPQAMARAPYSSSTTLDAQIVRLKLRHTWTTTMSSSEYRDNLYLSFSHDGVTGRGEGAPIVRYQENAEGARQAVESLRGFLISADPWKFEKLLAEVFRRMEGQYTAKAAIDIALMD